MDIIEHQVEQYLLPFDEKLVALTQELRQFLKQKTKPKYELVGDSTLSVNIGYGFTEKAWDCYCALIVYSKHINLSFPSGASLPDPNGILIGEGKRIRHIKITEMNDLKNPEVLNLIEEARSMAAENSAHGTKEFKEVQTLIKPIKGTKKRPK
jgi:hypothetical protein